MKCMYSTRMSRCATLGHRSAGIPLSACYLEASRLEKHHVNVKARRGQRSKFVRAPARLLAFSYTVLGQGRRSRRYAGRFCVVKMEA